MERKSVLLRAVERMLRPIVRQLLRHGVTFGTFSQLAKRLYYQVAAIDFALPNRTQSDSRIALITGLSRRDVAALRAAPADADVPDLDAHLATKLIDVWTNNRRFQDPPGTPRVLPFESKGQGSPSFVELVRQVGGDIPPRALLDELIRVGSIELQATRTVRLLHRAYIPAADSPERLEMFGEDVAEFANAIAHNLEAPPHEAFLQQKVIYDNIGSEGVPSLRAELRRLGETLLRRANRRIAAKDRDRNPTAPGGQRRRVVMGVYYLDDDSQNTK